MNFSSIIGLIKPFAPTVATMLGGPLAGAAVSILGNVLGLGGEGQPAITPENIQAAIEKGGDVAIASIQAAEQTAAAKYGYLTAAAQADAQQSQAVNATMQAEIGHISWYHWRNLIGYVIVVWATVPIPVVIYALATSNGVMLKNIIDMAGVFMTPFTILAGLCGYVAMDNTRRTTTALLGEHAPSLLGTLAQAVTGKH
ncbi:MAG TPA: hypothetical protein VMH83_07675 [Candidatus Acidoferrum sp.]|nr:hypothetical protein [Candidatus Acidoferrum sp.]